VALLAQWLGPELYDQRLLEATRSPRYSLLFFDVVEDRIGLLARFRSQLTVSADLWW
jgi:hypothetical protein